MRLLIPLILLASLACAQDSTAVQTPRDPFASLPGSELAEDVRPTPGQLLPEITLLGYLEVEGRPALAMLAFEGRSELVRGGDALLFKRGPQSYFVEVLDVSGGRVRLALPGLPEALELF